MNPRTSPTPSCSSARRKHATSRDRCSSSPAGSISSCTDTAGSVEFGVTYWSAAVGPYIWHEFDVDRVRADMRAMAQLGVRVLRTHLLWDAFMPTPRAVPPARLRDFETLLELAEQETLQVVPVMFAQSMAQTIALPAYAIDVSARRPGVRVISDAVTQPGAPRDQYTDPLMLEASLTWLETMLAAFGGHAALRGWDLGHDPATTMRPRRIGDMQRWAQIMCERVHAHEQRCMLTLGALDFLAARGVRPHVVAEPVDDVLVDLHNAQAALSGESLDPAPLAFTLQLAQRMLERGCGVHLQPPVADADAAMAAAAVDRHVAESTERLVDSGSTAMYAAAWSDAGPRALDSPPFDRHPELGRRGLVSADGAPTQFGLAWRAHARGGREIGQPVQWPVPLDIDDYYAGLPESANDLYANWKGVQKDHPGMLG